jgi:hypothetical protein
MFTEFSYLIPQTRSELNQIIHHFFQHNGDVWIFIFFHFVLECYQLAIVFCVYGVVYMNTNYGEVM